MLPNLFCPQCGRYLSLRRACAFCGYERLPTDPTPGPNGLLWQSQAGEGRVMGLALSGNLLAVALLVPPPISGGERGGQLALLEATTGQVRDTLPLPAAPTDPPAVLDDRLFLRLEGGLLLALALSSGEVLWQRREPTLHGRGTILTTRQALYLGGNDGRLHALSPTDGAPLWPRPPVARKSVTVAPLLHRRRLFFGDRAGFLHACDPRSGRLLWPEPPQVGRRIEAPPVPAGDFVLAVGSRPGGGEACTVEIATGEVRWRANLPGEVRAAPLIVGQTVHLVTRRGMWVRLGLTTGEELGRENLGAEVAATPLHASGAILFGLGDGRLLFVDAASGERMAVWRARGRIRATPLAKEGGIVFVGDDTGWVTALFWHRGLWDWAASWYKCMGSQPAADEAACHALAGDNTNDLTERQRHHETALRLWLQHDPLKAARFAEALLDRPPEEVAATLEDAANRLAPRQPWRASDLLWRAADLYERAERSADKERCQEAIARLEPAPDVVVRLLALPHFVAGQVGMVALVVHNRGHGMAQRVRVRMGGVLHDCLTFVLEPLLAGQEVELRANVAPTGPGVLRVETRYQDERGHITYGVPLEQELDVLPSEQPIRVRGEMNVLLVRYHKGTSPPQVEIEGAVGTVEYEAI